MKNEFFRVKNYLSNAVYFCKYIFPTYYSVDFGVRLCQFFSDNKLLVEMPGTFEDSSYDYHYIIHICEGQLRSEIKNPLILNTELPTSHFTDEQKKILKRYRIIT